MNPSSTIVRGVQRAVLVLALVLSLAGSALAGKQIGSAQVDGRGARAAVLKNRADRGLEGKVKVTYVGDSRSGKSAKVLVTVLASGKVEAYNVDKSTGVARRGVTGLWTQGEAAMVASSKSHYRRGPNKGRFAGLRRMGVSAAGNFVFRGKADRSLRIYVSPKTGDVVKTAHLRR